MIQIGATDDEAKANALLNKARARNRQALAAATPVAQKVQKGEDTFYRARFAGLEFGFRRNRLPIPQAQRVCLLRRPGLTKEPSTLVLHCSGGAPSLVAASEHPWPD